MLYNVVFKVVQQNTQQLVMGQSNKNLSERSSIPLENLEKEMFSVFVCEVCVACVKFVHVCEVCLVSVKCVCRLRCSVCIVCV